MLPFRTILCPLDFSEPSGKALNAAIEVAAQFHAEVVLVHVIAAVVPGMPADPAFALTGTQNYEEALRDNAKEQLTLAAQRVPSGLKSRNMIGMGDAADEIVRLATMEKLT